MTTECSEPVELLSDDADDYRLFLLTKLLGVVNRRFRFKEALMSDAFGVGYL